MSKMLSERYCSAGSRLFRDLLSFGGVLWVLVLAPGFGAAQDPEPASPSAQAQPQAQPQAVLSTSAQTEGIAVVPDAAETEFQRQIHVYQRKPFMRNLRLEITPIFGVAINETLTTQLAGGGAMSFHITDEISIGGSYFKAFHEKNSGFDEVEDSFGVFPEKKFRDWYAGGHVSYVPVYGKFILFGAAIVHFDAYLVGGAGVMRTYSVGSEGNNRISWNLGIGGRLFVTEWLTLNLELRDYMYIEEFKAGSSFMNNVTMHAGISIFAPFSYGYEYAK